MTKTGENPVAGMRGTLLQPVFAGLFSALIAVCAWIQVPFQIPFTMQTFAVFAALLFLDGKYGTLSIFVYILLGAVGVPVFAGFRSGFSTLFGATGGYITGFLVGAVFYWSVGALLEKRGKNSLSAKVLLLIGCLLLCYLFGTVWFAAIQENMCTLPVFVSALSLCVVPFLIPDALKLTLAVLLYRRLSAYIVK